MVLLPIKGLFAIATIVSTIVVILLVISANRSYTDMILTYIVSNLIIISLFAAFAINPNADDMIGFLNQNKFKIEVISDYKAVLKKENNSFSYIDIETNKE